MGRAAQARIITADYCLDSIQHAWIQALALYEMFRYLQDAPVHRQIIVARRDHQIHPANQTLLVDFVMMKEGSAWRFAGAHSLERIRVRDRAHVLRQDLGIVQQLLQALDAVQNFDQPGMMIMERTEYGCSLQFVEFGQFLIGPWSAAAIRDG